MELGCTVLISVGSGAKVVITVDVASVLEATVFRRVVGVVLVGSGAKVAVVTSVSESTVFRRVVGVVLVGSGAKVAVVVDVTSVVEATVFRRVVGVVLIGSGFEVFKATVWTLSLKN